jgi:hypothetical protein
MFRSPHGHTHLFQILFSKGMVSRESYPMSRAHLYAPMKEAGAEFAAMHAREAGRRAQE